MQKDLGRTRNIEDFVGRETISKSFSVVGPEVISNKKEIKKGEEIAVLAISFDTDGICSGGNLDSYMSNPEQFLSNNEWTFIYTFEYK